MENTEQLQKKLLSVKRGAYWFGIIGRLSVLFGAFAIILGVFLKLTDANITGGWYSVARGGLDNLIYGYLFLLGRDAFEAIEGLIREVGEIV